MGTKEYYLNQIPRYTILSDKDLIAAQESFNLEVHAKDDVLLAAGQTCRSLYFNCQGLVYSFQNNDDRKVLWFEFEDAFFTDINSFCKQEPCNTNIAVLEDHTILLSIPFDTLNSLYRKDHKWAFWGTQFQQHEFVKLTNHYEDLRIKDASERYNQLIEAYPEILQRVSLGKIASYLGISQVSLSRIRAGTQKKGAF